MFRFHRHLLSDEVRTNAYRSAIEKTVRPGDIVIDLGSGTGVLAYFACQAGAGHVYAIERQHSADGAAILARHLGFADRVTVLHAHSTEVELPRRADVLITDTLGPLVFNEGWLTALADANSRLLHPEARRIPHRLQVWAAPVELPGFYAEQLDWWNHPRYGFDFSPLRLFAASSLYSAEVDRNSLLAPLENLMDLDAAQIETPLQTGRAAWHATRNGLLHGFAIGFRAELAPGVVLTNAWSDATTWQQGVLFVEQPIAVDEGGEVTLQIETDGGTWHWRGRAGNDSFAQTTVLSRPPCLLTGVPV